MIIIKKSLLTMNEINNGISFSKFNLAEPENKTERSFGNSIRDLINDILDPTAGMSDEKKAAFENKIYKKIKNGEKLTGDELRYLQLYNPEMYAQISRIQAQRENLEIQLRNCKSKEEVDQVCFDMKTMINRNDPVKDALFAAYENVEKEFKQTYEYNNLPQHMDDSSKKVVSLYSIEKTDKKEALENAFYYDERLDLSYLNFDA